MKRLIACVVVILLLIAVIAFTDSDRSKQPWEKVQVVQVKVEGNDDEYYYGGWQGTGVFIADNIILTAGHIVDGANSITIYKATGGESYQAIGWYLETEADLGIIEVNTPTVESRAFFDNAVVGESVWAIGNPFGVFPVLTKGIVSAINMHDDFDHTKNMVITDCPINPGNSGCPLLNKNGDILGICSWGYIYADGMSYFVRAEVCQLILNKYQAIKALERVE